MRITPAQVREAAERTGITLIIGTSDFCARIERKEGCPIDALLVDAGFSTRGMNKSQVCRVLGLSGDYVDGFIAAVDDEACDSDGVELYEQGYHDGRAVAAEIFATTTAEGE